MHAFIAKAASRDNNHILLLVVARRYKYSERDDRHYHQRFAVDVYSCYL